MNSKMEGDLEKCERCGIYVPAKTFSSHVQEKRHRLREKRFTEMMQNSIFFSCLPKHIDEKTLTEELRKYGEVRSCSLIPRSNTAIVEFEKRLSAEICLRGPVFIQDSLVKTAPRREPKPRAIAVPFRETDVAPEALISLLERAQSFGTRNADKLIELTVQTVRAQNPERRQKMFVLQRDLERCISQLIPNCCALQFGSAVTGLTLKGSDADIVIVGPNEDSETGFDSSQMVKRARKLLWTWGRTFGSVVPIPEARIPIVKLLHIPTGIACDVSFQGQDCVLKSKELSRVLELDFRIRPLIIFLKYWGKCHNIINLSRFSSYATTLMVVFFLQQLPVPILPPIQRFSSPLEKRDVLATAKYTYSELAEEFFRYYGETDLINQVICPWVGHLVPCEAFYAVSEESLPEDVKNMRRLTQDFKTPLELGTPLIVQDPFELNRNVTERVKEKDFIFFRLCCTEAVEVMKKGNPVFLFKNFCVPSEVDMTTTLRADPLLKSEYLGPTEADETAARETLFTRWLKAILALLPEFLTRFVRLKVEPCDDYIKVPKPSEASTSKCNAISENLPRRWNCTGKPVLYTWTERKKTATKLKLSPELPMIERESKISEYLEQETWETESVAFTFLVRSGPRKETIRLACAAYTANVPAFNAMAGKILSIIPLWVKAAFECKIALDYIPQCLFPSNKGTKHDLPYETNICENRARTEEKIRKNDANEENMITDEQNIVADKQNIIADAQNMLIDEHNMATNKQNIIPKQQNVINYEKSIITSEQNIVTSDQHIVVSEQNILTNEQNISPDKQNIISSCETL